MSGSVTFTTSNQKPSKFLIYGLVDPRDFALRYVGQTIKGMKRPREMHQGHCRSWIISLLENELVPLIIVLQEFPSSADVRELLDEAEIKWIQESKKQGCNLTNHTLGGREGHWNGIARLPRKDRGKSRGPHSELTKQRISIGGKGKHPPREWTDEMRQEASKIRQGINRGPKSADHRRKISETLKGRAPALKGKKMSEKGKENLRKAWERRKK